MNDFVRATLRRPFSQQVAAFRLRLGRLVPTSRWDDLDRSQHDNAFMVAGATKADLLADLAAALDRAITEGTGIEAFRKDFREIVERRGWHGWTGEGTAKGEEWRMRVIYATNMRTSMMAGRLAQLKASGLPFWVYRHSGAENPRLHHLAWDGLVLPADHPFWATHYPPNGWGCGCIVRGALSRRGAARVGGKPEKQLPENWDRIDPRTGAPTGIGKGWDYAPGDTTSDTINALVEKPIHWPFAVARAFFDEVPDAQQDQFSTAYRNLQSLRDDLRRYADAVQSGRDAQELRTLGRITAAQRERLSAMLDPDTRAYQYVLDQNGIRHIFANHGDARREAARGQLAISTEDIGLIPRILQSFDRAVQETDTRSMRPGIQLSAVVDGARYWLVLELGGKRRQHVKVKTMWKRAVKSPPA
ncbi:MAG: phage minor head protein [Pseudomonadota bacterium]